uniref:C-type lectin domain-containing protein n=1 Tax=Myripristis murdjan TaxID=586833 RepID=A0A667X1N9_9TELE
MIKNASNLITNCSLTGACFSSLCKEMMHFLSALCALSEGFSRQFHFVSLKKNWTEAQRYCREHFTDLVTINNEEDSARLISLAEDNGGSGWIGLYDDVSSWRWSMDNTYLYHDGKAEFTRWWRNQPDSSWSTEHCGLMFHGGIKHYSYYNTYCKYKYAAVM